jgi:hypothetical protein
MASLNYTPSSFSNGSPADANQVNAVLAQIKAFVETETVQKDGAVKATNLSLDYTTVPQTTVATGDPTGGKNGDIWVKVIVP